MFGSESLKKLEQSLGYEQWILIKTVELYKKSIGYIYPRKVIIDDNNSVEILLKIEDHFDLGRSLNLIYELSPLLLSSGFKILDMLMEWIIKENEGKCPWKFWEKKKILDNQSFSPILPYPLCKDPTIFSRLKGLYINLIDPRNALIHGPWGKNLSGNLEFDFLNNRNKRIQLNISFKQVIIFADCMSLCVREVLKKSNFNSNNIISTIHWCLDELQSIHKFKKYGAESIRYFDVVRKTKYVKNDYSVINIKEIEEILEKDALGYHYDYLLHVEANNYGKITHWEIPSILIGGLDEIILDEKWDNYKL
ncbi:hypothetical protein M4A92_14365 [Caldibacillus thermoamylovorans]|uniref:hypothetical protein n=1 Tax=Caldibacillus thermoamylovorans TaxID=35841 RepID=UPI0020408BB3|nr:hypothetical protein [Caldibacillus thermoamylovorans]MCM3799786.1 hypothetical protein [Caldibacillus thermoamylovorans]